MGEGFFAATPISNGPSPVPIDWIGRCRGIVVIVRAQLFQEAKEQIVNEMGQMGFRPEEIAIRPLRGGA